METLRKIIRLPLILLWLTVLSIITFFLANCRRDRWRRIALSAGYCRLWAAGVLRIMNIRLEVIGDPEAFGGGLIVSNHLGTLDIPIHASVFPIRFAPKAEMRRWPLAGLMIQQANPVWIDRSSRQQSRRTADEIADTLRHRINMLVYPEGTSSSGEELLPFKSTPFEAAVAAGVPVLPVLTRYLPVPDGRPLAWFGNTPFLKHISAVSGLKEIRAQVYIMKEMVPLPGEDRKTFALRVRREMSEEYARITG